MAAPRTRVIRTSQGSKASVLVTDDSVSIIGDSRHFVTCDERGTTIKGPISMVSDAMGRRVGGLFVGVNDFTNIIPSTVVTPIPQLMPFPPVFMLNNIARDIAFFLSLLV